LIFIYTGALPPYPFIFIYIGAPPPYPRFFSLRKEAKENPKSAVNLCLQQKLTALFAVTFYFLTILN